MRMPLNLWTHPDIQLRFRRRSTLMRLGYAWLLLSVPAGFAVAWFYGGTAGVLVWFAQFSVWVMLTGALYRCLNCGAVLGTLSARASSRTGFNCNVCGCVHRESDGLGLARRAADAERVLPRAVARTWLYAPLLEQSLSLRRRRQAGFVLAAEAGLSFAAWMLLLNMDWNPLQLPHAVFPAAAGLCFAAALLLYFSASRCPHCRASLSDAAGVEHTNTLVQWCHGCGAVLYLAPEARAVYPVQGRVVDTPLQPGAPEPAAEVVAEADRLLRVGRVREACALIDRAMETAAERGPLLDWLRRNATALRNL